MQKMYTEKSQLYKRNIKDLARAVSSKWLSFSLLVLCIVLHLSAMSTLGDDKLDKTRFHDDDDCRFGGRQRCGGRWGGRRGGGGLGEGRGGGIGGGGGVDGGGDGGVGGGVGGGRAGSIGDAIDAIV